MRILSSDILYHDYPTDKSVKQMVVVCLHRIKALGNKELVNAIATQSEYFGKQIWLCAVMQKYRIGKDCMIDVVENQYQLLDSTFDRIDLENYLKGLHKKNPLLEKTIKEGVNSILPAFDCID